MPYRLEITLKPDLSDPEGQSIKKKAEEYFGINIESVRTVHVITIDADLSEIQLKKIQEELFTNPVTQISSFAPLALEFDRIIWVGFRPGVRDNPGATAVEAVEDILGISLGKDESIYTSKRYCLKGQGLTSEHADIIAGQILANDIIQQWKIYSKESWEPETGTGIIIPKVILNRKPTVTSIPIDSDKTLKKISDHRNLALNPNDIPVIRSYFLREDVKQMRDHAGLFEPTDIELEYISQARSDHCNHNTFRGLFKYQEGNDKPVEIVNNLFKTCIESPTLELKDKKDWVISVLWDNAGAGRLDKDH